MIRFAVTAFGLALLTAGTPAMAGTVIASCTDGQKLQLNINTAGPALLYAKTPQGTLQMASGRMSSNTNTWTCALPHGSSGPMAFQWCITRANAAGGVTPSSIIIAKVIGTGIQQQGVVCAASIKNS